MKNKLFRTSVMLLSMWVLQGCIAFPPLVQIEHKHPPEAQNPNQNAELIKRLDAIDQRLEALEKQEKK